MCVDNLRVWYLINNAAYIPYLNSITPFGELGVIFQNFKHNPRNVIWAYVRASYSFHEWQTWHINASPVRKESNTDGGIIFKKGQ